MGQVTIYIDDETEQNVRASARAEGVSLSRWVAERIQRRARGEWPESVRVLAGAWSDLPSGKQIRRTNAKDLPRVRL